MRELLDLSSRLGAAVGILAVLWGRCPCCGVEGESLWDCSEWGKSGRGVLRGAEGCCGELRGTVGAGGLRA